MSMGMMGMGMGMGGDDEDEKLDKVAIGLNFVRNETVRADKAAKAARAAADA